MTAVTRIGGGALDACQWTNITLAAPTTTLIISGPGELERIVFNKPVATGVVTIYDGLTAAGTVMATITIPASPQPSVLEYHTSFSVGLCIVTSVVAQDLTVCIKP